MEINNREYAVIIYTLILFLFFFTKRNIRELLFEMLRLFMHRKILYPLMMAAGWVMVCITVLNNLGIWSINNLKTTIVWSITFAFASLFEIKKVEEEKYFFKKQVKNTLSITVILIFIMELQTFSFISEMIILPIITFLSLLIVVGDIKEETKKVSTIIKYVLSIFVIFYFIHSLYISLQSPSETFSKNNLTEFLTPITLSLMFLPFVYIFYLAQAYETAFASLEFRFDNKEILKKAKLLIIMKFRNDVNNMRILIRELNHINNIDELNDKIHEIKERIKNQSDASINRQYGTWSPLIAKNLLSKIGLVTNDYHPSEDEWWAYSPMIEIGEGEIIKDNIAFYIYGNQNSVKKFKIRSHINNLPISNITLDFLKLACTKLISQAAPEINVDIDNLVNHSKDMKIEQSNYRISVTKENFEGSIKGYTLNLSIEKTSSL